MDHELYYHIVWTTRERRPLIDVQVADFLCRFLRGVAGEERAHILELGIVRTHVHVLLRAHPATDLSRLLQRLKGGSSFTAGRDRLCGPGKELKWAKGYAIRTVSPQLLRTVRDYLRAQPTHHADLAIEGWAGCASEYESAGREQWVSPLAERLD